MFISALIISSVLLFSENSCESSCMQASNVGNKSIKCSKDISPKDCKQLKATMKKAGSRAECKKKCKKVENYKENY